MTNNNRIVWIDLVKGLGIVLMVIGHYKYAPAWSKDIIYSFHMPIFFVISGMLASSNKSFRRYFESKALSLLIPFVLLTSVIGGGNCMIANRMNEYPKDVLYYSFVWNNPASKPLWFLYTLFITDIIYFPLKYSNRMSKIFLAATCFAFGIVLFTNKVQMPLRLDIIPFSLGYYLVGNIVSEFFLRQGGAPHNAKNYIALLIAWAIYIPTVLHLPHYDLYCHGGAWYSVIMAIIGSLLFVLTVKSVQILIPRRCTKSLSLIAANAVVIIAFHSKLFWIAEKFEGIISYFSNHITFTIFVVIFEATVLSVLAFCFNRFLPLFVGKYKLK